MLCVVLHVLSKWLVQLLTKTLCVVAVQRAGHVVAVKVFHDHLRIGQGGEDLRELELLRRLKHDNIISLYAIEQEVAFRPLGAFFLAAVFLGTLMCNYILKIYVYVYRSQSSGAVRKSRWPSWAPVPNKPTVSVDVKQHSASHDSEPRSCEKVEVAVPGSRP